MSRSYKKYPIFKVDKGGAKWEKIGQTGIFANAAKAKIFMENLPYIADIMKAGIYMMIFIDGRK